MFQSFFRKALAASVLSCSILFPAAAGAAEKVQAEKFSFKENKNSFSDNWGEKLLWYIPNRCMDLLDCFTVEFGFGANIRTNLLLTRWIPIGAGAGPTVMIGWNGNREGGIYMLKGTNADFLKFRAADQDQSWIAGNYPKLNDSGKEAPLYVQQYKDPLTIGFEGGCIGNVKLMVHFSSFADFVAGIFLVDLQNDDIENQRNKED